MLGDGVHLVTDLLPFGAVPGSALEFVAEGVQDLSERLEKEGGVYGTSVRVEQRTRPPDPPPAGRLGLVQDAAPDVGIEALCVTPELLEGLGTVEEETESGLALAVTRLPALPKGLQGLDHEAGDGHHRKAVLAGGIARNRLDVSFGEAPADSLGDRPPVPCVASPLVVAYGEPTRQLSVPWITGLVHHLHLAPSGSVEEASSVRITLRSLMRTMKHISEAYQQAK